MTRGRPASADSHLLDVPGVYRRYISSRLERCGPRLSIGSGHITVPGILLKCIPEDVYGVPIGSGDLAGDMLGADNGFGSPSGRVLWQQEHGVDAELLFPSLGLVLMSHPDVLLRYEFGRAYSRWAAEYSSYNQSRLICVGLSGAFDETSLVADLRETVRDGLRAIAVSGALIRRAVNDRWDAAWRVVAEHGLVVCVHAYTGVIEPKHAELDAAWDALHTVMDIVSSGVLLRWPGVRVLFAETDIRWLEFLRTPGVVSQEGSMDLSDLVQPGGGIYVGVRSVMAAAPFPDLASAGHLLWYSDLPHRNLSGPTEEDCCNPFGSMVLRDGFDRLFK